MPNSIFINLVASFSTTFLLVIAIYPIALKTQLIDKPSPRKDYQGEVPLIGGIAIWLGLAICLYFLSDIDTKTSYFLLASGLIVLVGAVDDRFNLSVRLRMLFEVIAASVMIFGADLWVGNLGNLLGLGEVHMPFWVAYLFTVIAVFGIVNAINMIDGMDGLASGIGLITLTVLLLFTDNSPTLSKVGSYLVGGLLGFFLFNIQVSNKLPKIFLGDAGSKLIGLTLVWVIIEAAQSGSADNQGLNPVTALYIIGLPLIDMVALTIRRVKKGKHPFHPDQTHIHHILMRARFSKTASMAIIFIMALSVNLIGITLQKLGVNEAIQFAIFAAMFLIYSHNTQHIWKLERVVKKVSVWMS